MCGVLGIAAAVFATGAMHPPAYALDSTLVYRCEIGGVVFAILYFFVVLLRLASYGRTPTSIGAGGTQLPDVGLLSEAVDGYRAAAARLNELPDQLIAELAVLRQRIAALEDGQPEREHGH